jgi:hypothetical protein
MAMELKDLESKFRVNIPRNLIGNINFESVKYIGVDCIDDGYDEDGPVNTENYIYMIKVVDNTYHFITACSYNHMPYEIEEDFSVSVDGINDMKVELIEENRFSPFYGVVMRSKGGKLKYAYSQYQKSFLR